MSDNLILLSDIIIRNPGVSSFQDLLPVVRKRGQEGTTLLQVDIKPDYPDTPRNWEWLLEAAFTRRDK